MKTPVLIVVITSVVVLCTLPAIYIFLAFHTHKERQRWKVDYDRAVKRIEAEAQNNPRPASAATHTSIYSSKAPGRAPSARQSYYYYHHHQQPQAPARPAPAHNPRAAPPRPPRELSVSRSSRNYLPQADTVPRGRTEGVGRSVARPAPGSRPTTRSGGTEWTSSGGSERQKQEQVSQQIALQLLLNPSVF